MLLVATKRDRFFDIALACLFDISIKMKFFCFTDVVGYFLTFLGLFTIVCLANGHGMMCEPRQRGAYVSQKCGSNLPEPRNPVIDHCAHCLNGGSKGTVSKHLHPAGWFLYEPLIDFTRTATRAGLCGDPKDNNDHMIGGTFVPDSYGGAPIVAHWKSGSTVDFTAEIDTNHNGYFEYYLCNLDACGTRDISGQCFMQNDCYKLMRVKHNNCENPSPKTHTECGPIDDKYPGRWYLPCRKTDHVGIHIVGGSSGTMRYQLPKGVKCDHCVVQWYWATANSCAPRGFLEYMTRMNNPFGTTCPSDGGGRGAYNAMMSECSGSRFPEEFWSCADVKISATGGAAGGAAAGGNGQNGTKSSTDDGYNNASDDEDDSRNGTNTIETDPDRSNSDDSGNINDERETDEPKQDIENGDVQCGQEGHLCDEKIRCCENQELVCVLRTNEMSTRCTVWWKLKDMISRRANRE